MFIFVICESTYQRTDGTNSTEAATIKSYQEILRSSIILTVATKPKEGHCQTSDDLTQAQAEGLKKISTERLRSRLITRTHQEMR